MAALLLQGATQDEEVAVAGAADDRLRSPLSVHLLLTCASKVVIGYAAIRQQRAGGRQRILRGLHGPQRQQCQEVVYGQQLVSG